MKTTDAILAMLPTYPYAWCTRTVAHNLGISSREASARLCKLHDRGAVVRVRQAITGRYSSPATWAKPAQVEEVNP